MKGIIYFLLLLHLTLNVTTAFSRDNFNPQNNQDTLSVFQIDSILRSVKEGKVGEKIAGKGFSENYHYNEADNKIHKTYEGQACE